MLSADTTAQTPSSSRNPHCRTSTASTARTPDPTRFKDRYPKDFCARRPTCAAANAASTSRDPITCTS